MSITADFMKLKDEEKEAVGLLQMGTFLEYLDLMLYVHMAVFLNDLFFPPSEKGGNSLLSSFAFCAPFIFRPFGALLFGWIGDNIGRKTTIIITTFLMSLSCLLIASLPTYTKVGVSATWILLSVRAIQGTASMGEIIGAEVYLTEILKGKIKYPLIASVDFFAFAGSFAALGITSLFTIFGSERWRLVFWAGAGIAVLGSMARTRLRETPDFTKMKDKTYDVEKIKKTEHSRSSKEVLKTFFIYSFLTCACPSAFYFVYIYCGNFLKSNLGATGDQVVFQNFIVISVQLMSLLIYAASSYWIYPLKILKFKIFIFSIFVLACPYWLSNISTPFELLILQCTAAIFAPNSAPAIPIFVTHFPVLKRFRSMLWSFTISRSIIFTVTSFCIGYITSVFGYWGWWTILIPTTIAFIVGIYHFEGLEKNTKGYEDHQSKSLNKSRKIRETKSSPKVI